ncbi:MAG TPA: PH domain-containing protein [Thermomicrobiales bacterium]|nr:PH domain-containing protein [Thermomicrobiales bacterium]
MAGQHAPREHLDPRALTLWRVTEAINGVSLVLIAGGITAILRWQDVGLWWSLLPLIVAIPVAVALALLVPGLRYRQWRYEIGDQEVDLQHGIWTITRTLIPMARIQHVDTERGPLQQRLGLASVVLYTAAGASEIPALSVDIAAHVRDRIAALANVGEV